MEIYGADLLGIEGYLVRFRALKEGDRRGVTLLGLAQKVVREGYVRAAKAIETLQGNWDVLRNQGYTIDLNPAETPKTSPGLALPMAIMILVASILQDLDDLESQIEYLEEAVERVKPTDEKKRARILDEIASLVNQREKVLEYQTRISRNRKKYLLIGTFDIPSGRIEAPRYGMFGMIAAAKQGFTVIVPEPSEVHAALIAKANPGIRAYKAADLQEVWDVILGVSRPRPARYSRTQVRQKRVTRYVPDLRAIEGVSLAKRAMMVAVAGGHNILLVGPPGQGKGMLAQAAVNLLPDLHRDEMYELNKIYSAAGELGENEVILNRPFQEVSNATRRALFGGGHARDARPGLISMAHKGILLFDEINTWPPTLIEELRRPLNDRVYRVQRVNMRVEYPCNFILVAAMNPCKCGWYHHYECPECGSIFLSENAKCEMHPQACLMSKCRCSAASIEAFRRKLSKPLLDRIDLKVLVSSHDHTSHDSFHYATTTISRRIQNAREMQRRRYRQHGRFNCNAEIPDKSQFFGLDEHTDLYLRQRRRALNLTPRMEVKLLLVSRTVADLHESKRIGRRHMDDAVNLMGLSHEYFRNF